jgi:hypothetical protein
LLLLAITSCQASFGEKYTRGNLEIYFTEEMKAYVEPTADYFESHGLIQDKPHSIQLTSSDLGSENPGFILKMIVSDPGKEIPENEKYNVQELENDLKEKVFQDPNFRISLCNENFVEI